MFIHMAYGSHGSTYKKTFSYQSGLKQTGEDLPVKLNQKNGMNALYHIYVFQKLFDKFCTSTYKGRGLAVKGVV